MYVWFLFSSQIWTMSHPSWLPPKSTNEPVGHVTARMETTHAFGTPSISVSTQQTPKKFAPVVAPKPKYNPYKQPGGDGEYVCVFFCLFVSLVCVFFFLGRIHRSRIQGYWPLTQTVFDKLLVHEFVGSNQSIRMWKNLVPSGKLSSWMVQG